MVRRLWRESPRRRRGGRRGPRGATVKRPKSASCAATNFGRRASQLLDRYAGNSARRLIILLLLLAGLGGAGIGCTSTTNLTSTSSGATPLGVATLKVTGSAYVDNTVVSQSVYFTVNVTAP